MYLITTSLQPPVKPRAASLAANISSWSVSWQPQDAMCHIYTAGKWKWRASHGESVKPGTQGESKDSAPVARIKCKSCLCYRLCDPGQVEVCISFSTQWKFLLPPTPQNSRWSHTTMWKKELLAFQRKGIPKMHYKKSYFQQQRAVIEQIRQS